MPTIQIPGRTKLPIYDAQAGFAGGLVSYQRKNLLAPSQFAGGINTTIDKEGRIRTRRGWHEVGTKPSSYHVAALTYMDLSNGIQLLLRVDGQASYLLYTWNGTTWTTWSAINGYLPPILVPALSKIYNAGPVTGVYSFDGTAVASEASSTNTDWPRQSIDGIFFQYRMFVSGLPTGGQQDTVYFSDLLNCSTGHWDLTAKSFRVGAGDGDPIMGICGWTGTNLLIFKRSSIWLADVSPTNTLGTSIPIKCIHRRIGCVAARTICQVGTDVWFLSDDGVRSVNRILAGEENEISLPISLPIQDQIDQINKQYLPTLYYGNVLAGTACAIFHNNRYLLAVPMGTGNEWPTHIFSYNTVHRCWEGVWTGIRATQFCRGYFSGQERLYVGTPDGYVLEWRDHVSEGSEAATDYQDKFGTSYADIATTITCRGMIFGEPLNQKRGLAVETEFDHSDATSVTIKAAADETASPVTLATVDSSDATNVKKDQTTLLHLEPFREVSIEIAATAKKLAVRSVAASAFLRGMPLGK